MYAKQLRENLAKLSADMHAIIQLAERENNRALTSDEAERWDRLEADYSNTERSITRAETQQRREASLGGADPDTLMQLGAGGNTPKDDSRHGRIFSKYLRGGIENLDGEEKQFMAGTFQNTMSTTTGSQGGYLVPQGFADQLETAMKWFGGIEGTVDTFQTSTGNPLPWPTVNDTGVTGEIVGQNVAVANADIGFGQANFSAYIFSSKMVKVPLALMQDSAFNIDALVARLLGTRLGRIINTKMTVGQGSGSGEPNGIVTAAVAAGLTYTCPTGETTSCTVDDLTNLEHTVDPSYRDLPTSKYMFHDSTLKMLKKLKDASNRPLWQPALTASFGAGAQPTINDHGYVINNDMPVMAANANSMLFGDMSNYKVRKVAGDVQIMRLVERFAEYLQVGFLGYVRRDGNLIDAGTHPVAVLVNSAT